MGEVIAAAVKGKENVILAGDFNVNPGTKTTDSIEEHLRDVFKGEIKSTFNMKQKTNPAFESVIVDMVYVSPDIKVGKHSCPNINVSDHLPLIVEIEI